MFWIIIALGLAAADIAIKMWIKENKRENSHHPILGGKIIITKYFNPGAMLGFLKDKAKLLLGISMVCVGLIAGLLLAAAGKKGNGLLKVGLTLLLGGAASNVFERALCGKVTDYFRISIGNKKLESIIFNIGDFFIFIGAILSAVGSAFQK